MDNMSIFRVNLIDDQWENIYDATFEELEELYALIGKEDDMDYLWRYVAEDLALHPYRDEDGRYQSATRWMIEYLKRNDA